MAVLITNRLPPLSPFQGESSRASLPPETTTLENMRLVFSLLLAANGLDLYSRLFGQAVPDLYQAIMISIQIALCGFFLVGLVFLLPILSKNQGPIRPPEHPLIPSITEGKFGERRDFRPLER